MVKKPPLNAGHVVPFLVRTKIPHPLEQQNPRATIGESVLQQEILCAATETLRSSIKKKKDNVDKYTHFLP